MRYPDSKPRLTVGTRITGSVITIMMFLVPGCMPRVSDGTDVSGAYSFETQQDGRPESAGLLTLERATDGGWNAYLFDQRLGQMEILEADVNPPGVSIIAEGPDNQYRIPATVSGRLMEGQWRYGGRQGRFVGRRP